MNNARLSDHPHLWSLRINGLTRSADMDDDELGGAIPQSRAVSFSQNVQSASRATKLAESRTAG